MTYEKLIQSEDMCEGRSSYICEKMNEDVYEGRVCPLCGSPMQHDYDRSIETGSSEMLIVCYWCGHTE